MRYVQRQRRIVEAVQWSGDRFSERPDWLAEALIKPPPALGCIYADAQRRLAIHTSTGWRNADPYDMVVLGVTGVPEPCAPAVFFELYEPDQPSPK
jgi:hypothetical protein